MTPDIAIDLMLQALRLVITTVAVLVVPGLITGLLVSLFQAATQINEQTLSFLPRLIVTLLALAVASRWLITQLMDFCVRFFNYASTLLH
jgi:flagellar biosynthesis protein FliQ